ncbi:carbohydrate ABC transporter permease [Devosia sp. RR2S18]|jgi:multiple sugar transport system permease protein|uniref:carbohydrate ABC transporter permease n=1 Tax=Devosia rhizosphaerae TaxID=3049774 RepID=UPI0025411E73|nr:sugar ABC transporter permease [Devosia sp. RR2S18]WIJ24065.1 sugar ABC transporter permease [Devosia sp. RR2S18]
MLRDKRQEYLTALVLVGPFIIIYGALFVWPTIQMVMLSFTDAPLIGPGEWVGLENYFKILSHRLFHAAFWNTAYFVVLTVVPNTLVSLAIAMAVNRLKGWQQSLVLAAFFLPYILPVSVVFLTWNWIIDVQYGLIQWLVRPFNGGEPISLTRTIPLFMPTVAFVTIWWTLGFNVLLFIAGLRNISPEIYEAAALDSAGRWRQFARITWPLIWPVTALVLTIQLIAQLKIFDQVYLFSIGGRQDATIVLVQYIYKLAFQQNRGGEGATAAVLLFAMIIVLSVLQYQLLRARGEK